MGGQVALGNYDINHFNHVHKLHRTLESKDWQRCSILSGRSQKASCNLWTACALALETADKGCFVCGHNRKAVSRQPRSVHLQARVTSCATQVQGGRRWQIDAGVMANGDVMLPPKSPLVMNHQCWTLEILPALAQAHTLPSRIHSQRIICPSPSYLNFQRHGIFLLHTGKPFLPPFKPNPPEPQGPHLSHLHHEHTSDTLAQSPLER